MLTDLIKGKENNHKESIIPDLILKLTFPDRKSSAILKLCFKNIDESKLIAIE